MTKKGRINFYLGKFDNKMPIYVLEQQYYENTQLCRKMESLQSIDTVVDLIIKYSEGKGYTLKPKGNRRVVPSVQPINDNELEYIRMEITKKRGETGASY